MNPASNESGERLIEIFDQAKLKPAGKERARFLAEACGARADLRREIDELLGADAEANSFLSANSGPSQELEAAFARFKPEEPGDCIGHYKLLEQIGEGGFGAVWVAEQARPVRRRVALKIIKLGMDTKEVIARFEQERQALAMMDHANIAKVFDAGTTETGRPFFVMELVHGIKITDYCDQANLATNQRLQLFMAVCNAVQHAHLKGIIHRDLKPSNILVTLHDGVPVPKVIDFGVAKATQQQRLSELTVYTQFAQMIGTPAYMSPEQAEMSGLDIDTRSDIYSLGVCLYELLTGRTPFDPETLMQQGLDQIRRIIREVEPAKPSTAISTMAAPLQTNVAHHRQAEPAKLIGLIRGDLDWIVMKALEKDRTRRYETANAFAADLQHHLQHEPVTARPPSRAYRFRKLVQRNKLAVAAAAAVTAALIIGLGAATWMFFKERFARERAQAAEKKSNEVAAFLQNMLEGVGPSVALGRDTTLLREILDKTAARIGVELKGQPHVEAELRSTLGATYLQLGDFTQAENMAREVLRIRESMLPPDDPLVVAARLDLARVLARRGGKDDLGEAGELLKPALEEQRKLFGANHPEVARWVALQAGVLHRQGRFADAEAASREALEIRKKHLGLEHKDVASSMDNLALVLRDGGKLDEAESIVREALAIQQKVLGSGSLDAGTSLQYLGSILERKKRLEEAEHAYRDALELNRKQYGGDNRYTETNLTSLAGVLRAQGKHAAAARAYREELELRKKLYGEESPKVGDSLRNLGSVLVKSKDEAWTEVLQAERARAGNDQPGLARLLQDFAVALRDAGQAPKAEPLLREAVALRSQIHGSEHQNVATPMAHLALVLRDQGKLDEAEAVFLEVISIRRKVLGPASNELGHSLQNFGGILQRQKKFEEAETAYREALEINRKLGAGRDAAVAACLSGLAAALRAQGKDTEAASLYRDEVTLRRQTFGEDSPRVVEALKALAEALHRAGDHAGADRAYQDALHLSRKVPGLEQTTAGLLGEWGSFLHSQRRFQEAVAAHEQEVKLRQQKEGSNHQLVNVALGKLALAYKAVGRVDEATAVLREKLALKRAVSAAASPEIVRALHQLAEHLLENNQPADAEPLIREALGIARKGLENEDGNALDAMFDLAICIHKQGRFNEAEAVYRELLPASKKAWTEADERSAPIHGNLGYTLLNLGKYAEAAEEFRIAVELNRTAGRSDKNLAICYLGLGRSLLMQKRYSEAESLFREALAIRRRISGNEHQDTIRTMNWLGSALESQGKHVESEEVFRELLALRKQVRGPENPDIENDLLTAFDRLARALIAQNKPDELKLLIQEELRHARAPDPKGATVVTSRLGVILHHAALALHTAKASEQARSLAEEAWQLYEQHPDWPEGERSHALQVLEAVLTELGDHAALASVQRRSVERLRANFPPDDPVIAGALANLVVHLLAQQKFAEAEAPAREALAIREKATPDDWRTFNSRSQLGGSLLGQKKLAEAEPLLLAGYEGMKQREASISPGGRVRLEEALQRLAQLCEATGERDKAAEWKKKLSELEATRAATVRADVKQ